MAEEYNKSSVATGESHAADVPPSVETSDRGLFDFAKKKDDHQEEAVTAEFQEKMKVSEPSEEKKEECKEEKKHETLLEKLHRSGSSSSSSSSSDEEEGDDEEKKRRKKEKKDKKSLKEKIDEKIHGGEGDGNKNHHLESSQDTTVPIEKIGHHGEETGEEKKGFMDKIKNKLPGGQKKPVAEQHEVVPEQHHHTEQPAAGHDVACAEGEKKGFLEKIKDKIPGFHSKTEEEKEKEKEKLKE